MLDTETLQKNGTNGRNGAFLVGLVCGAAAGAAAGMLFAPKSGDALRRQLAESTDRLRKRAVETYGDAIAAFNDAAYDGTPLE